MLHGPVQTGVCSVFKSRVIYEANEIRKKIFRPMGVSMDMYYGRVRDGLCRDGISAFGFWLG